MIAIFGEILTFGQTKRPDIQLRVTGDEFYAIYETLDGYTTVSDSDRGYFCYVALTNGVLVSTGVPASGLAIYHCDILGSNEFQMGTGQRRYQCAPLQADGNTDLEHNVNQGDGTDLFGAIAGVALSNATTPSTRLWNGSDSGLVLVDVEVPDSRLDFRVGASASVPSIRAESTTMVPIPDNNPAGVSSAIVIARPGSVGKIKVSIDITQTYIGRPPHRAGVARRPKRRAAQPTRRRPGEPRRDLQLRCLALAAHRAGQPMQGSWTLRVADAAKIDTGTLNKWSMEILPGS